MIHLFIILVLGVAVRKGNPQRASRASKSATKATQQTKPTIPQSTGVRKPSQRQPAHARSNGDIAKLPETATREVLSTKDSAANYNAIFDALKSSNGYTELVRQLQKGPQVLKNVDYSLLSALHYIYSKSGNIDLKSMNSHQISDYLATHNPVVIIKGEGLVVKTQKRMDALKAIYKMEPDFKSWVNMLHYKEFINQRDLDFIYFRIEQQLSKLSQKTSSGTSTQTKQTHSTEMTKLAETLTATQRSGSIESDKSTFTQKITTRNPNSRRKGIPSKSLDP